MSDELENNDRLRYFFEGTLVDFDRSEFEDHMKNRILEQVLQATLDHFLELLQRANIKLQFDIVKDLALVREAARSCVLKGQGRSHLLQKVSQSMFEYDDERHM
jgi:hypothetical protein